MPDDKAPISILPEESESDLFEYGKYERPPHPLTARIDLRHQLPTGVYGAMLAIWHLRRVAQRRFPLHRGKTKDYLRYLAWCATWGRQKYKVLTEIPEWDLELAKRIELPNLKNDHWHASFSVGQFLFGVTHFHYTISSLLRDSRARRQVALAYWRGARHLSFLPPASAWQQQQLMQCFGDINRLIHTIATPKELDTFSNSELINRFKLHDIATFRTHATATDATTICPSLHKNFFYLPWPRKAAEFLSLAQLGSTFLLPRPSGSDIENLSSNNNRKPESRKLYDLPFGVNLFGHARGELGIGEDVRLVAIALSTQGVPFCIVDVQPGNGVSQNDYTAKSWISESPKYAINIFCMTGIEHIRYVCETGINSTTKHYNIGIWPWELPEWPKVLNHAYTLVDEIWGISRFTAESYNRAPCPVFPMTLPVTIDKVANLNREHFKLNAHDYIFIFTFDANSTYSRKNPLAVIKSFKLAFPLNQQVNVQLVIKGSHVNINHPEWRKLQFHASLDKRIRLIAETWRKPEVLALMRACDCYVSLHRSEGFGRSIAEAILLGRSVIATGYSGNLDYCHENSVKLVDYSTKTLKRSEYFFSDGQVWAEPNIQHAAQLMREITTTPHPNSNAIEQFSPARIGKIYYDRLRTIKMENDIDD